MQQKTPLAQMSKRRLELTAEITHPLKSVPDTFYCLTPFTVPRGTRAIVEDSFQRRHTKQKRENRLQRLPLKFGIQAKSDNPNHWVAPICSICCNFLRITLDINPVSYTHLTLPTIYSV